MLTNKRKVFVAEYLKCWNASEAARRAGYKGKPNVVGPRLLANVSIQERIKQELEVRAMSSHECLTLLSEIARGEQPAHPAQLKALELVGKAHAMFVERHKQEVQVMEDVPDYIEVVPPGTKDE